MFYAGGIAVTVGSLLAVGASYTPHHPLWIAIFGEKAFTNITIRNRLRNLGFLLMLVPFVIWLAGALRRMGII